jgi:hypothetical protein
MLCVLHGMLSRVTGDTEWLMSDAEAKHIADVTNNLLSHYNVKAAKKTGDWIAFGTVVGAAYGGRFLSIERRKRSGGRAVQQTMPNPMDAMAAPPMETRPPAAPNEPLNVPQPPPPPPAMVNGSGASGPVLVTRDTRSGKLRPVMPSDYAPTTLIDPIGTA